jgi:phosphoribosylglycinamide formyltransferase-1
MWQLMETEAAEAGAMLHLVTPVLDKGPPVAYVHFSIQGPEFASLWQAYREKRRGLALEEVRAREGDGETLFAKLRAEELRREFPLILLTLRNLACGRLVLTPEGVRAAGELVPAGFDVTPEVEEYLRS